MLYPTLLAQSVVTKKKTLLKNCISYDTTDSVLFWCELNQQSLVDEVICKHLSHTSLTHNVCAMVPFRIIESTLSPVNVGDKNVVVQHGRGLLSVRHELHQTHITNKYSA